jgi:hypothetical protein
MTEADHAGFMAAVDEFLTVRGPVIAAMVE